MPASPDGAPPRTSEAAAQRRWLITIAITVVFGGFGAIMAYLSYAKSTQPAVSTPAPRPAPTAPAAAPSSDPGLPGKDRGPKNK